MVVKVCLHTSLQRRTAAGLVRHLELDLAPGATLEDLLGALELPEDLDGILLVLNGRIAEPSRPLADGDDVHLIPALSGG